MGIFDFLSGNTPDYAGDFGGPSVAKKPSAFENLFSNETFIRSLGETGAKISAGVPIGTAVGEGASSFVRNTAVQREGAKEAAKNQSFQERMLAGLMDGSLLSPTSDNVGADMITYDGDGNITIKAKKSPAPVGPLSEQHPLEAITNKPTNTANRGSSLPDFTSDQGSTGNADFSGLDPADVQMILGVKQSAGALTQRAVESYLDNKYKNKVLDVNTKENQAKLTLEEKKLDAAAQQKILERNQKVADRQQDRIFEVGMAKLKNQLGKAEPGTIEYNKIVKEMENLDSKIAERAKGKTITPAERERLDNEKNRIEMAVAATEVSKQKDTVEQQKDAVKYEEVILSNLDTPEVAPMMDFINQNQNKPYYYTQHTDPGIKGVPFTGGLTGSKVPLITKNGIQMDMASVRASAKKYGMSVEDYLASPGIGILTKGENNDYQPINR